jgi:hypothetical protein
MKSRRVYIPVVLIALLCIGLLVWYFTHMPVHPDHTPGAPRVPEQDGEHFGKNHGPYHGLFTLLSQIAIVFGAVSFFWLRFKKKLGSPNNLVKKLGKIVYSAHTYAGWAALILVVAHSVYFLITDFSSNETFSGLAAFFPLLGLGVYGYLLKRYPNRFMRAAHMGLSLLWIPALLIHGGGIAVLTTIITAVAFVAVWWLDKQARQATATA